MNAAERNRAALSFADAYPSPVRPRWDVPGIEAAFRALVLRDLRQDFPDVQLAPDGSVTDGPADLLPYTDRAMTRFGDALHLTYDRQRWGPARTYQVLFTRDATAIYVVQAVSPWNAWTVAIPFAERLHLGAPVVCEVDAITVTL
jgi:hypothetical protein